MKLLKFNSMKTAVITTIIYALLNVMVANSLQLLVTDDMQALVKAILILLILYTSRALFMYISNRNKMVAKYYIKLQYNQWVDKKNTKTACQEFLKNDAGQHASIYVNDIPRIIDLTCERQLTMLYDVMMIVFIYLSLLRIHWLVLLIGIIDSVILTVVPFFYEKKLSCYIMESQEGKEKFLNKITEILSGYQSFLENSAFSIFMKKSKKVGQEYAKSTCKIDSYSGFISSIMTLIDTVALLCGLSIISYLVINGKASSGMLLSALSLLPSMGDAVAGFMTEKTFYKTGKELYYAKMSDVEEIYDSDYCKPFFMKDILEDNGKEERNPRNDNPISEISTKDINIHYGDKSLKIKDIRFEKNKKYAIIGESGCGKSSLFKVIVGEIQDYSGEVRINGNVKEKKENIFDSVAFVNQNTFLISDTVYHNLVMSEQKTEEEAQSVLSSVKLENIPLDFEIKENGKNISGGQKQRIALARAILRDKNVIFMDESTANLDSETAHFIEDYILNQKDKMVIMITHHMDETLKDKFDEIIDLT